MPASLHPPTSVDSFFVLPRYNEDRIYRTYDQFATKAFRDTFRDLSDLENGKPSHAGSHAVSAIAYWYLTLESFMNTQLAICCTKSGQPLKKFLNLNLMQRLLSMLNYMDIDKNEFNENEIIGKLHEMMQFRNILFEERYEEKTMILRKTSFSNYPLHSNIHDTFQAMLIVLEITERLNEIFPGVQMMPEIVLSTSETKVRRSFYYCYKQILLPCFLFALEKNNENNLFDLSAPEYLSATSRKFKTGEVVMKRTETDHCTETVTRKTAYCLSVLNANSQPDIAEPDYISLEVN
jgi:hypothetical protein